MINLKAGGYQELPEFPEVAPDPSVRNVEVSLFPYTFKCFVIPSRSSSWSCLCCMSDPMNVNSLCSVQWVTWPQSENLDWHQESLPRGSFSSQITCLLVNKQKLKTCWWRSLFGDHFQPIGIVEPLLCTSITLYIIDNWLGTRQITDRLV